MKLHSFAALALLLFATGCSTTSVFERLRVGKASPENPAIEVVCLWQPAKGTGANGLPTRGMAGQIMFFTRGSSAPVMADGDVRIYEFDDQGTADELRKPIHQFDFLAADWQNFQSQGTLGPCYNIFVPYVKGGHKQVEVTMQLRFTPKGAPTLYSDMTSVTLPGSIDPTDDRAPLAPPLARNNDAASPEPAGSDASSGLSVKSIETTTAANRMKGEHPLARTTASVDAAAPRAASGIQPASYEVPAASESSNKESSSKSDARIRELEQMIRDLTQKQAARQAEPAAPLRHATPRTLEEAPARRLPAARADSLETESDEADEIEAATPRRRFRLNSASAPATTSRSSAPGATRIRPQGSAHPLRSFAEEDEAVEPTRPARAATRVPAEEEASEEAAPSKRIRVRSPHAARTVEPAEEQDEPEITTARPAKPAAFEWQGGDPWQSN
jgi:hypothetical protein